MKTSAAGQHDFILLFHNKNEKYSMHNIQPYFVSGLRIAYSSRHSAFGRAKRSNKKEDRPRKDGNLGAVIGITLITTVVGGGGQEGARTLKESRQCPLVVLVNVCR
jgi:hypothetical protein